MTGDGQVFEYVIRFTEAEVVRQFWWSMTATAINLVVLAAVVWIARQARGEARAVWIAVALLCLCDLLGTGSNAIRPKEKTAAGAATRAVAQVAR